MGRARPASISPVIFNVYKPKGLTSADVVFQFKKHLPNGFGKIGHLGTLDPFAEGVLFIALAGASRLSDLVHEALPKRYEAVGIFGVKTASGDMTNDPINHASDSEIKEIEGFSTLELEKVAKNMEGDYMQVPPCFSASKFEGRPLYKWAREGTFIKKEAKKRMIYEFNIINWNPPEIRFEVLVSSGTYIRTLFEDFAAKLYQIGALKTLIRTSIGPHSSKTSIQKSFWPKNKECYDYSIGIRPDDLLKYDKLTLDPGESLKYYNGQKLKLEGLVKDFPGGSTKNKYYWVYDESLLLLGLGKEQQNELAPYITFPKRFTMTT